MAIKDVANRITKSAKAADLLWEEAMEQPKIDEKKLAEVMKEYIGLKQQLEGDEVSDNITIMVRISVSKATGIPFEKLKEMDKAGACGSAPAVLAKRVLLFLDIQKKLGITFPPEKMYGVQTVQDLAKLAIPLMESNET